MQETPNSIPGWGRSPGEGIVYPLQYSWASLVAQLVKNPLAMQETWVRSLGWEDLLEKGKATHSSIPVWRIPWTIQVAKSWTRLSHFHFHPLPSRSQRDVGAEACGLCVSCWVLLSLSGLRRSQDRSQGWTDVKSFSWGLFLPPQNSLSFPGTFQREQNLAVSLYSLP